jgi:amino acid adenylation domain-containing protein
MTLHAEAGARSRAEKEALLRRLVEDRIARVRTAPASFAQERLWVLFRMDPSSAAYNVPTALRLSGGLDVVSLARALGELVRRHETLRTTLDEREGRVVQVIAPAGDFPLPVESLAALPAAEREAAAARRAAEEGARPFDLVRGPLFHARLLRLADDDHVLLLCTHHVVTDGWSAGVLHRELWALYAAFRDGHPSPLPAPRAQYADYAAWQRREAGEGGVEGQLAYWKERLAGAPALLDLPVDHPRPAAAADRGARETIQLSPALLQRLEALSRAERGTLFMVLLAAFQLVLARWAGTDDVVVGTPVAGRTRRETEALIGFFVNLLVMRGDLSGDPPFRTLLGRVRDAALGAYRNQDVPFDQVVDALRPERVPGRTPLFQVLFVLQNLEQPSGGGSAGIPGLTIREMGVELDTARFDLTLAFAQGPAGLGAALEYRTDLFERGTIRRMLGHLTRVLEQAAAAPDLPVSRISLLDAAERRRVVEAWNGTDAAFPADATLHALVQAQARRTPHAPAVTFEGEHVSYAELNARANRLARHLRRAGVGPEARVAVCLERGIDLVISLLAVLKSGGAYLPLDPEHPAERLGWMMADAGAAVLLTDDVRRALLPSSPGIAVISVDGDAAAIGAEDEADFDGGAGPRNAAYVIYTSGSTGRPKGVVNEHRGIVNRLCWMQAEYGLGADDVVLQKTPFGFDVSVWEFFWPLLAGARLVMARPGGHRDPHYLQRVIEGEGVTTVHFVPSMLQPFVEQADPARCRTLARVICSGEALPAALVARFYERFAPPVALHNLYGPTEAAVDVSAWPCARGADAAAVPIGRPVWNTRLYVLDTSLQPAPAGVPGELFIGGVQVARGYQGRPALTAERFVPDPFAEAPGARLYRTGDRARWRERGEDAALEYLGRLDHQVKIRGFRIEPGEIESALLRHPAVAECAVVARDDTPGGPRLVAYIAGTAGADELRAHLRRTLPEHMVPAEFVALDRLPHTPNGKLDRRALPAPGAAPAQAEYVAPRTADEAALAALWAEVLGLERVGARDDFFAIGGHSLLATRVAARVRETLDGGVDMVALFDHPTPERLAAHLAERRASGAAQPAGGALPAPAPRPISPTAAPAVDVDELSDEEVERLLAMHPDSRSVG